MRIALAQVNATVGDLGGNAELIVEWTRRAAGRGARVVVFPEMMLTGYPVEDLVFREEGVKVTLALSKRSVDFFKREAEKHNTQYQRMIRRLLDAYAERYAQPLTKRIWTPPGRQEVDRA